MHAVDINALQFTYPKSAHAFNIDSWSVAQNEHTFLYGPSGSGKSTLLNLLSGILVPQKGDITLLEKPFSTLKARQRDQFRAQHIGVVFQEFNLIPFLTVWENIELASSISKKGNMADAKKRAEAIFARLQLDTKLLAQRADTLSVGQRQRVSIARALINRPEILIADEPTSALDTDNRDEFMRLLIETSNESACTVIFVSHDQGLRDYFSHQQDIRELLAEEA